MGLYLYTKNWDAASGADNKITAAGIAVEAEKRGEALLADPAACAEAIARYQGGETVPAFAREWPDLGGIEGKLPLAKGKEHIVVIGNGGSIRNVWALYEALSQASAGVVAGARAPAGVAGGARRELHLLDGTDPDGLLGELISARGRFSQTNTLLVPVSKSGETENVVQETRLLVNAGYTALAVISPGQSKLAALADEKKLNRFPHPVDVGGRFTAGQNNALLPLALALGGMETPRALDAAFGAAHARLGCEMPPAENMAKALALRLWRAELAGRTEIFFPVYRRALSGVGALAVQLVHESYCKEGRGQTLLFAEGPESQHHTNQRYFGGRGNIAGLSLRVRSGEADFTLGGGVSAGEFLDLEHAGVIAEAERRGVPHMVLTLDALCAEDVASVIALWQWAAVYGGILREVNPFDQPAVEGSKKATAEMFDGFGPETRSRLERYTRDASHTL